MTVKLYKIYEDDLAELERIISNVEDARRTVLELRHAQNILNNVRNNYEDSPAPKPEIPELKPTPYPIVWRKI